MKISLATFILTHTVTALVAFITSILQTGKINRKGEKNIITDISVGAVVTMIGIVLSHLQTNAVLKKLNEK